MSKQSKQSKTSDVSKTLTKKGKVAAPVSTKVHVPVEGSDPLPEVSPPIILDSLSEFECSHTVIHVKCPIPVSTVRTPWKDVPLMASCVTFHKDGSPSAIFLKVGKTSAIPLSILKELDIKEDEKIRVGKKTLVQILYTEVVISAANMVEAPAG